VGKRRPVEVVPDPPVEVEPDPMAEDPAPPMPAARTVNPRHVRYWVDNLAEALGALGALLEEPTCGGCGAIAKDVHARLTIILDRQGGARPIPLAALVADADHADG
jgi:hypothetical protein